MNQRLAQEMDFYDFCEVVHDHSKIFHYYTVKYLESKIRLLGVTSIHDFFSQYIGKVCREKNTVVKILSLGAGNCDFEIDIAKTLLKSGVQNFVIDCMEINPNMLERGKKSAEAENILKYFLFTVCDINEWAKDLDDCDCVDVVMANQTLHHLTELERIFDKIFGILSRDGYFLVSDLVGKNGHMRWPEALDVCNSLWKLLDDKYKYNNIWKRVDANYFDWDCSYSGFEGIRSQDILGLLIEKFGFELFFAWGNIADSFVIGFYGPNFDVKSKLDTAIIDFIAEIDEEKIENGEVKPTHLLAAMTKNPCKKTRCYKNLTPKFCFRDPLA